MLKKLTIVFSIIFMASAACTKPQTETGASNSAVAANTAETAGANAAQTKTETKSSDNSNAKNFLGSLDNSRVQINLIREGNKLSGTYSYAKVGTNLNLAGTIDGAGKFTLQETDQAGKQTGEWKGDWKESDGRVTLTGNWKSPKGGPELTFSADEQLTRFSGSTKIVTKSSHEDDKNKHYKITNEYPELTGVSQATADNFNGIVKKIVADADKQFKDNIADLTPEDLTRFTGDAALYEEVTYDVVLADDDLVSVLFNDASYTGGAHGSSGSITLNFDLKNNRELQLSDLFEPNSNYLKTISDYSIPNLKSQLKDMSDNEQVNDGAGPKEENFKSWNLTKKGLRINFDAYQVAAYAAGPQTVDIPYAKLKSILRKGGIAANLAK